MTIPANSKQCLACGSVIPEESSLCPMCPDPRIAKLKSELAQARAEIERLKQCIDDRENGDTMLQAEFENLCAEQNVRPSDCCAPKYCALAPFHEIELLGSERDSLRAQLEQMRSPMTDEEFKEFAHKDDWGVDCVYVDGCNSILAARARRQEKP